MVPGDPVDIRRCSGLERSGLGLAVANENTQVHPLSGTELRVAGSLGDVAQQLAPSSVTASGFSERNYADGKPLMINREVVSHLDAAPEYGHGSF